MVGIGGNEVWLDWGGFVCESGRVLFSGVMLRGVRFSGADVFRGCSTRGSHGDGFVLQ